MHGSRSGALFASTRLVPFLFEYDDAAALVPRCEECTRVVELDGREDIRCEERLPRGAQVSTTSRIGAEFQPGCGVEDKACTCHLLDRPPQPSPRSTG